jgi:hypothetical protein
VDVTDQTAGGGELTIHLVAQQHDRELIRNATATLSTYEGS